LRLPFAIDGGELPGFTLRRYLKRFTDLS